MKISTRQAAAQLHISPVRLRACVAKRLIHYTEKLYGDHGAWLFEEDAIAAFTPPPARLMHRKHNDMGLVSITQACDILGIPVAHFGHLAGRFHLQPVSCKRTLILYKRETIINLKEKLHDS
jgi:hypothetical protein